MKKLCKILYNDINFVSERIVPCGSKFWDNCQNPELYFIKPYDDMQEVDFDYYIQQRNKYIQMYLDGEEPEFCNDCNIYEPLEETHPFFQNGDYNNFKFKKIFIYNQTKCSCRCIYCCLADNGNLEKFEELNQQKNYDIAPILKQMEERNMLDEHTEICVFGGECTEYPEDLGKIVDYGLKHNCSFSILTNGIIYNEKIAELLKNNTTEIKISLDCGTKATFEKIKRVKAFDRVIENIKKYSEAAKTNPNAMIHLKYILCPGINDNVKELKAFFNIIEECKSKYAILAIDKFWMRDNVNKPANNSLKKFIKYWFNEKDFPNIVKSVDYGEIRKNWLDKILEEKKSFWFFR